MAHLIAVILEFTLELMIICAYITFRCLCLIVRVFVKYPKQKVLWWSLGICLVCILLAWLLYRFNSAWLFLGHAGFFGLTGVCKVVEVANADMFLDHTPPIQAALNQPWWNDPTK